MDAHSLQPPAASYQVLLEVAEAIAAHRDLGDLFHDLAGRLHRVVQFDYLNLILHDAKRKVMRLHTLETSRPTKIQPGLETPVEWSAAGYVMETQQPLVVPDLTQDERFPKMRELLLQEKIVSYCILPLTTACNTASARWALVTENATNIRAPKSNSCAKWRGRWRLPSITR